MAKKYNVMPKITSKDQSIDGTPKDDKVTIAGEGNIFYAKKGNDDITVASGQSQKVFGEEGNDIITVNKKATSAVVYGGPDKDTITIKSERYTEVYGGAGNDVIKVNYGFAHTIDGETGNDKIELNGGNATVYGGAGDDTITVNKGSYHTIFGNDQNDSKKGTNEIYINGSDNVRVFGGKNTDRIWIKGGKEHFIYSGKGKDFIYLQEKAGKGIQIDGGEDVDTIEVTAGQATIHGGAGKDKINISSSGNVIYGDTGVDTIKIIGGNKNEIYCATDGGYDKIYIKSKKGGNTVNSYGTGDQINVSKGKANIINVYCKDFGDKKTSGKVTLTGGTSSIFIDNLDETAAKGKLVINAAKGTAVGNTLTIDSYAKDTIFSKSDTSLLITYKSSYSGTVGGTIEIQNFANGAFSGGITFGDGIRIPEVKRFDDIKKECGF